MDLHKYIEVINKRFTSGISREHAYRSDLESLFRYLVPDVEITNEPANVTDCGNPDYVITKNNIPIGFIEAKDIGKDLNHKQYKHQFDRYRKALDNLIITDYIWFKFYQHGKLVHEIRISEIYNGKIKPIEENFDLFSNLIKNFCEYVSQTIKSPIKLAGMMAAKARLLENILENAITSDEEIEENTSLKQQYNTFKDVLIHNLSPQEFSDIYAQTLAYGMFAARLHDKSLDTFSRQEAAELIPKSNPFLRKLFNHVAGIDIDGRIRTTVDNLAEVFRATNVEELLKNFGKGTLINDPIIHFYETFLSEYDPKLRKSRGVWYTPEPVVNFIVRAVDDVLKNEFNLCDGIADTTKTTIKYKTDKHDRRTKSGYVEIDKEVHKVQVLDPATGTGTFLAEVVKYIYSERFKSMQGAWSGYVEEHLIPRLNGFEILMASYSMAHLKLDMLLTETGYSPIKNKRFNVYLTNSLEEHHPDTGTLFSSWLSTEANEANNIKRDTPVMVVLGNPPYSSVSSNMGEWIVNLIEDYKYVDGVHFDEKKHWLHDDYVKFIRYGEFFVEKNGEGVLAYINNHGFIDNPTFRGMRWHLLTTFDKIYIIDLHGNSKKKEVSPDGKQDKNIFDIQQGVSINIFIKTGNKNKNVLADVFHCDIWGSREFKYNELNSKSINDLHFKKIVSKDPYYFFIPKNYELDDDYNKGFKVSDLFIKQSMGITTARDNFVIDINKNDLISRIKDFCDKSITDYEFQSKYNLKENYQWKLSEQRREVPDFDSSLIESISYRPFDKRYIYYQDNLVFRMRKEIMCNLKDDNIALCLVKLGRNVDAHNYFVTDSITDKSITSSLDNANVFPLYI